MVAGKQPTLPSQISRLWNHSTPISEQFHSKKIVSELLLENPSKKQKKVETLMFSNSATFPEEQQPLISQTTSRASKEKLASFPELGPNTKECVMPLWPLKTNKTWRVFFKT